MTQAKTRKKKVSRDSADNAAGYFDVFVGTEKCGSYYYTTENCSLDAYLLDEPDDKSALTRAFTDHIEDLSANGDWLSISVTVWHENNKIRSRRVRASAISFVEMQSPTVEYF